MENTYYKYRTKKEQTYVKVNEKNIIEITTYKEGSFIFFDKKKNKGVTANYWEESSEVEFKNALERIQMSINRISL